MIDTIIEELKQKFNKIKQMNLIESKRNGSTGIGYTFETLLGKEEDQLPLSDFNGIEIKTRIGYSKSKIKLFHLTPKGNTDYQIKAIYNRYGWTSKRSNSKVFAINLNTQTYSYFSFEYKAKLFIDYKNEKIVFEIYDKWSNMLIDNSTYWSFKDLRERIYIKLNYLAIITGYDYKRNNKIYYKYTNLEIYKFTNFYQFINLIDSGIIEICFNIGTKKNSLYQNPIADHGTAFTIAKENIDKLFNVIYK